MAKRIVLIALLVGMGLIFYRVAMDIKPLEELSTLASSAINCSMNELKSQNVVTAIVVTMRGLDTLGEVAVLFISASGIGFLLGRKKKIIMSNRRKGSEILRTGSRLLLPLIMIFGCYIFLHGHLTPGGGFQGGVVIATGLLLALLSDVSLKMNHRVLNMVESLSGVSYVAIGFAGIVFGAGLLDSRIIPLGTVGMLFSAGAIPLIYSFIGLKVGSELTGIITNMAEETE